MVWNQVKSMLIKKYYLMLSKSMTWGLNAWSGNSSGRPTSKWSFWEVGFGQGFLSSGPLAMPFSYFASLLTSISYSLLSLCKGIASQGYCSCCCWYNYGFSVFIFRDVYDHSIPCKCPRKKTGHPGFFPGESTVVILVAMISHSTPRHVFLGAESTAPQKAHLWGTMISGGSLDPYRSTYGKKYITILGINMLEGMV